MTSRKKSFLLNSVIALAWKSRLWGQTLASKSRLWGQKEIFKKKLIPQKKSKLKIWLLEEEKILLNSVIALAWKSRLWGQTLASKSRRWGQCLGLGKLLIHIWPQRRLASTSSGLNVAWPQRRLASTSSGLIVAGLNVVASKSPGLNVP